ncbi:unnamed protein product [Rotaria sp. Silwood2]|nr:unnamed protein product [Rotaria sp. Silwood2]CAF3261305.1 unnamed protein product [Rotaria sp. Silwood2]CAF3466656.1 unnamed protein product [Rotaria sp. Silwood2]CAF4239382.1 unnamed protein product [Rotaria sp. Silwood2]CAF4284854.1 unnamed protein product [Rotaria sp. Silwood2]
MSITPWILYLPSSYHSIRSANKYQFQSIAGFHQHPNSSQEMTIELSVDIDKISPELISLLEKISRFQEQWQESIILKQMIKRYYQFMQLKASLPTNVLLIPTLDIEIIWQTHLLRPEMYQNDCVRLFHRVIDHSLIVNNNIEQFFKERAFLDTYQLYEQKFGEKYCELSLIEENNNNIQSYSLYDEYESLSHTKQIYSYWDKTSFEFSSNSPKNYENPFSFTEDDIILDGKWFYILCRKFMGDVMIKLTTHGRFLYIAAKYRNSFIPPIYDIDIIWYSHMQEPLKYASDCIHLVGYVIFHDPWPTLEDENMKKSYYQIWNDEFQCDIEIDHLTQ